MDVTVHSVKKITTKVKQLSGGGPQVVTLCIETDDKYQGFTHEIICIAADDTDLTKPWGCD